jgi:hypothetical protein
MTEQELKVFIDRHLETARKIVEFVKFNPPSYKVKLEEAPKHVGYESGN